MYQIIFDVVAENDFKKIDRQNQKRILNKLDKLKLNPKLGVPLTASLAGFWKLRIGKFRVIYQIRKAELVVFVIRIGHRKNVYD